MHRLKSVSQEKIIRSYVPEKLIPVDWTHDQESLDCNLDKLISEGNNALRLFQDDKELCNELQYYAGMPGNFKLFGIDHPEDIFRYEGPVYNSLKNKEYAYIGHYFHIFHQIAKEFRDEFKTRLIYETIVLYLKCLYSRVKNHSELVPFDDARFKTLHKVLISFTEKLSDDNQKSIDDSKNFTRKCFKTFRDTGLEGFEVEFQEILNRSLQILPMKKNGKSYYKMYASIDYVIKKFDDLYKTLVLEMKANNPVVRLFHYDSYFAHTLELFHALEARQSDITEEDTPTKQEVVTFESMVEEMGTEGMKRIEFVKVSIPTLRFSVPIMPTFDRGYFVFSKIALDHITSHMILVDKVFQMMTADQFTLIEQFYGSILKKYGKMNFIDYPIFELMKQEWSQYFETHFKNPAVDRKEVRNVDETRGFTLEDLKDELKYLGLTEVFPEILDYSEKSYSNLIKQEAHKLNTASFIHRIYRCQIYCVYDRLYNIFCTSKEGGDGSNSTEPADHDSTLDIIKDSELAETREELCGNESTITISADITGSESTESSEASSSSNTTAPVLSKPAVAPPKKKRVKQPKLVSQKPNDAKPVVPESKACDKCFRSSQNYRSANAKLKLSDEKNKQMSKELANSELEAEQLKEVVRKLREKLHQKDVLLHDMTQEKEKLEQELSEKNVVIEVLKADAAIPENPPPVQLVPNVPVSDNTKEALLKLLSIRNTIQFEKTIEQSAKNFNEVIGKSKNEEIKEMAKTEMKDYHKKFEAYENAVETQINQILAEPNARDDPNLPEFPVFSEQFQVVYKKILRSDAPKICEPLCKDLDCVICHFFLSYPLKTVTCAVCRNSCHHKCATDWFKHSNTCPTCIRAMYDDTEFPKLS